MDLSWLNELGPRTAILVPTRSLANALHEQIAHYNIAQGIEVWEAPEILVWTDYLRLLWQANRDTLSAEFGVRTLISSQQSLLLWTQVIEASRREERELTLLNVQQTARAVQRSWRLMGDWRVSPKTLSEDHVADTKQFLTWLDAYQSLLRQRALIDEVELVTALCEHSEPLFLYDRVIWYAYDLVTAAQQILNTKATQKGVLIEQRHAPESDTDIDYVVYSDTKLELKETLQRARRLLEQDSVVKINVVVPDLQQRYMEVRELARQVFYPAMSPIQVQQNNTAYRFSLGQPLNQWAAIETALSLLALLKNRCTVGDISFLLRNQFLRLGSDYREPCRAFDRWLKSQRLHQMLFDDLPSLYAQFLAVNQTNIVEEPSELDQLASKFNERLVELVEQRQTIAEKLSEASAWSNGGQKGFAALSFVDWATIFDQWLASWGWQTTTIGSVMNTVQHQLQQRWLRLLEEFAALSTVQRQAGMKRAIEVLEHMCRDAIFLPQAAASPIIISSLFEAIGRPVDMCFLTGMNQDYPAAPKADAFVPNRLLLESEHPDATAGANFQQAKKVNQSLLRCSKKALVSYAHHNSQDTELPQQASAIYRKECFSEVALEKSKVDSVALDQYVDVVGPTWPDASLARGGSKIFENQSHCEFKAFVTHQLSFQSDDEAQFGLDSLDRGNVVHRILELVWGELQTQHDLLNKTDAELQTIIEQVVVQTTKDESLQLSAQKRVLLQHERPRLLSLVKNWLALEAQRPEHFSVVEREEARVGTFAGIQFKYTIDRLDMTDDGRSFIIDYKTGAVNRKDWTGERIKSPQMPLYAVALDAVKNNPVSGIAFAKVNQSKHEFVELSEARVFRKKGKDYESIWQQSRATWGAIFTQLAQDFLAGKASVNPIDDTVCQYCDLQSVCRISQLSNDSADLTSSNLSASLERVAGDD